MKNLLKLMVSKKGVTDLTSAKTSEVGSRGVSNYCQWQAGGCPGR